MNNLHNPITHTPTSLHYNICLVIIKSKKNIHYLHKNYFLNNLYHLTYHLKYHILHYHSY